MRPPVDDRTLPDVAPVLLAWLQADGGVIATGAAVRLYSLGQDPKIWPALLLTPIVDQAPITGTDHAVRSRVTLEGFAVSARGWSQARAIVAAALHGTRRLVGHATADLEVSGVDTATGIQPLPHDEHGKARASVDVWVRAHRMRS